MEVSDNKITMRVPDNFHAHFRHDARLQFMVHHAITSGWRGRFLAMPNLPEPILELRQALDYSYKIMEHVRHFPNAENFEPVLTIQITEETTALQVMTARRGGIRAAKVYPRNVTTNSAHGVVDYQKIYPALAAAEEVGMIICFHGESPDPDIEGCDKEAHFIEKYLNRIRDRFPELKIVLEHITTSFAADWVRHSSFNTAATIPSHYLLTTQDDILGYTPESGFKGDPHLLCKPMHKWRRDRDMLRRAAVSGDPRFFYGGDDAPHYRTDKETAHCACGVFNTTTALPLLISLFDQMGCLNRLEDFLSRYGAEFYGYPLAKDTVTFTKQRWKVPESYPVAGTTPSAEIVPFWAGRELEWEIALPF